MKAATAASRKRITPPLTDNDLRLVLLKKKTGSIANDATTHTAVVPTVSTIAVADAGVINGDATPTTTIPLAVADADVINGDATTTNVDSTVSAISFAVTNTNIRIQPSNTSTNMQGGGGYDVLPNITTTSAADRTSGM